MVVVNDLSGKAPALTAIADRTILEGDTLAITNTATEPGSTSDPLTFILCTNAPGGAALDATNGIFTWTPSESQGPSTNLITVTLLDGNIPGYSSSQNFTVTVLESNSPPVLAPIADRIVHAGTILSVSNSATDPDIPANILTFSLGAGAPSGASINASNGLFVWRTSDTDANTTNLVTVVVTDNGLPNLSDTKAFTIIVVPRPTFTFITQSNAVVALTWSALPGNVYEVQYQDFVTGTNWVGLMPAVTASNTSACTTNSVDSVTQRFYRIHLLP